MRVGSCCAGAAAWQPLAPAAPCRATQRPHICTCASAVLPAARLAAGPTLQVGPAPGDLACSGPTPWWYERPGTVACSSAPGHPMHALHGRQPAAAHRSHHHSAVRERHNPCSVAAALWAWRCLHGSVLCSLHAFRGCSWTVGCHSCLQGWHPAAPCVPARLRMHWMSCTPPCKAENAPNNLHTSHASTCCS